MGKPIPVWVERSVDQHIEMVRVLGEHCGGDEYILDFDPSEDQEIWAFAAGERVRCEKRQLDAGEPVLVAIECVIYRPTLKIGIDVDRAVIEIRGMEKTQMSRNPSRNEPFFEWLREVRSRQANRHEMPMITSSIDESDQYCRVKFEYDSKYSPADVIRELVEASDGLGFTWIQE